MILFVGMFVQTKSILCLFSLLFPGYMMICRNQALIFQLFNDDAVIPFTVLLVPYSVTVEITNDDGVFIVPVYVDALIYTVFFNVRRTRPYTQQVKGIIDFQRQEMTQAIDWPVIGFVFNLRADEYC